MSRTILFIHGMYMTPLCWEGWLPRAEARGHRALAPAWPFHDAPVAEQRRAHPDPARGGLTLEQVVDHYAQVIKGLEGPPVLIGHSMGGLIVQLLLQRGLGAAGVVIDSAPPKGVISLKWSFLKSNWPHISPFADKRQPVMLTPEQFGYSFVNGLPPEEQRAAYERYVVPESRLVGQGPTTAAARIDFRAPRPPLLILAGGDDNIIPASLNRDNFGRYRGSPAVTEFKEFPGRTHYTIGQKGWEEVADYAFDWIAAHGGA